MDTDMFDLIMNNKVTTLIQKFQAWKNRGMKISWMKIWNFMQENCISMHENEHFAPDIFMGNLAVH